MSPPSPPSPLAIPTAGAASLSEPFTPQKYAQCAHLQAVLSLNLAPEAVGGHVTALSQLTGAGKSQAGWARQVLKACEALMDEFVAQGGESTSDHRAISALYAVGKVRVNSFHTQHPKTLEEKVPS